VLTAHCENFEVCFQTCVLVDKLAKVRRRNDLTMTPELQAISALAEQTNITYLEKIA